MTKPAQPILDFLNEIGATGTQHLAGRMLEEHLLATWRILHDWRCPQAVCIAGLYHSVYGTDHFDTACLGPADRPRVRAVIGEDAERLAYLFGAMVREPFYADPTMNPLQSRFDDGPLDITEEERRALCDIFLANELDLIVAKKGPGRPDKVIKKVGPVYAILEPYLCDNAKRAYEAMSRLPG